MIVLDPPALPDGDPSRWPSQGYRQLQIFDVLIAVRHPGAVALTQLSRWAQRHTTRLLTEVRSDDEDAADVAMLHLALGVPGWLLGSLWAPVYATTPEAMAAHADGAYAAHALYAPLYAGVDVAQEIMACLGLSEQEVSDLAGAALRAVSERAADPVEVGALTQHFSEPGRAG